MGNIRYDSLLIVILDDIFFIANVCILQNSQQNKVASEIVFAIRGTRTRDGVARVEIAKRPSIEGEARNQAGEESAEGAP